MKKDTKTAEVKSLIKASLDAAAVTFQQRGEVYGDSYLQFGKVVAVLFPNGIDLQDEESMTRFGLLTMMITKMTRYCNSWDDHHKDSIHDLGVYAFMLEGVDDSFRS